MKSDFTTAYLGLGSNLGDRAGNLLLAVRGLIEASFEVCKLSAIYETEPVDIEGGTFLNMAAEVRFPVGMVAPSQMMARLLRIEYLLGRRDKTVKRARTIDLDMLFFGNLQSHTDFLTLPHPRLHLRRFVLCPLAEIAPDLIHPTLNRPISDILTQLDDPCEVKRWTPDASVAAEFDAINV